MRILSGPQLTAHPLRLVPATRCWSALLALTALACAPQLPSSTMKKPDAPATGSRTATATRTATSTETTTGSAEGTDTATDNATATATNSDAGTSTTTVPETDTCLDWHVATASTPPTSQRCDLGTGTGFWTELAPGTVETDSQTDNCVPTCVGNAWPLEGQTHVREAAPALRVTYGRFPPTSGNHWGCWEPWGIARRAVPPERFIHNLEHAGIVLLYRCPAMAEVCATQPPQDPWTYCPQEAAQALAFFAQAPVDEDGQRTRYVISPAPQLSTRFAALAWGWSLESDTLDTDAFNCFVRAHLGAGPEKVLMDAAAAGCR